jgi:predicted component of type VI protein secretion system
MAKLQVLSGSMAGQTHELKVEKTTIGRVEDNAFQIAEPSVSSHHCEVILSVNDVIIRDLNSTNGTFINGEKITESVLKPGQTLKLGQVELRIDDGSAMPAPSAPSGGGAPAAAPAAPTSAGKSRQDQTMVVQRGVSLNDLTEARPGGFDTATSGFTKKSNKVNRYFLIGGIIIGLIIVALLIFVGLSIGGGGGGQ